MLLIYHIFKLIARQKDHYVSNFTKNKLRKPHQSLIRLFVWGETSFMPVKDGNLGDGCGCPPLFGTTRATTAIFAEHT